MLGLRTGLKTGLRSGFATGLAADPIGGGAVSMTTVAKDAASNKYVPANPTQWATTTTIAGVPSISLGWDMQDVAGSLAPSVGAISLASEGSRQAYRQAIAGWTRLGVQSLADGWLTSDASLPDISTTDTVALVYAKQNIAGATNVDMTWVGALATAAKARVTLAKKIQALSGATTGVAGASDPTGSIRPYVININATTITLYTDQEKVTVAKGAASGKGLYVVGGLLGDDATFTLAGLWAATMTDAQVKSLLQTLNWTIPWS
jgi:hypothetical protein